MIKTVTGFKTRPLYVTAIQVLPNNLEAVKEFCPTFNYYEKPFYSNTAGNLVVYGDICEENPVYLNDFIVKINSRFIAKRPEEFYEMFDRAEE